MRVTTDDVDTLVALALAAQRGDLDAELDVGIHRGPDEADKNYAYWRAMMVDVVNWSDGALFELHSEHSDLYEEIVMDGWRKGLGGKAFARP